ncbi:MAG: hypothetical protein OWS74_01835 [Firmicutes bacterium]|nr:hypothetical protein [Bacillota bacterium]
MPEKKDQIIAIAVGEDGNIYEFWGRTPVVALATIHDGAITDWQEYPVGWDIAREQTTDGNHHATIARWLMDHHATGVAAVFMGGGMEHMLDKMGLDVYLDVEGNAREIIRQLAEMS